MDKVKKVAIKNSRVPSLHKAEETTPMDLTEQIEVVLYLRRNRSGKDLPSLEELSTGPPLRQKRINRKEFRSSGVYGAHHDDVEKVKAFAKDYDLTVEEVRLEQRTVTLSGSVASFNNAFNVKLTHLKLAGKMYRTHREEIHVPEGLKDIINSVFGLDNLPAAKSYVIMEASRGKNSTDLQTEGKFFPVNLGRVYDFPDDAKGKGQSIAIIELGGGYKAEHLRNYFENVLKMPMPNISDVLINSGKNEAKDSSGTYSSSNAEVYLDIEVVGAIANEAKIYVYFCPNTLKDFFQSLKHAVHDADRDHSVISISWGEFEGRWNVSTISAFNETLHEAASLGISVCIASGDLGVSDTVWNIEQEANVDFPASSPYSLSCGGTTLTAKQDRIASEVVWNDKQCGASGGGVSAHFDCPAYQSKAGINPKSANPDGKIGRGVPDVAGNADKATGYIVQVNNEVVATGGTSAVAPLYTALLAIINQKLNSRVGFIIPFLYSLKDATGVFNDITEGNNSFANIKGYEAVKGWDACTGWGSINGKKLLEAIQKS